MYIETVVKKGTDDETDFLNYIDSATKINRAIYGMGIIFIKNVPYSEFKTYIDDVNIKWTDVLYIDFDNHYELWLEVQ